MLLFSCSNLRSDGFDIELKGSCEVSYLLPHGSAVPDGCLALAAPWLVDRAVQQDASTQ